MKLQLFAVLLVVAGSYALPRSNVETSNVRNAVEHRIRRFVDQTINRIIGAGLDPLDVERRDIDINLESLNIVLKAFVENVLFTGASDIRINTLEYSYIFNRLRLDISLPEVSLSVGDSGLSASIAGTEIEGQLKGSLSIQSIRIAGVGYVDGNIITGINVRSMSLNCSVGDIESDLTVVAQGSDRSELVNNMLNNRIPDFLNEHEDDINRGFETILTLILNRIWSY